MSLLRATVRLRKISMIPEDDVINVWHFATDSADDDADAAAIAPLVASFYEDIEPYLSPTLQWDGLVHQVLMSKVTIGAAGPDDDTTTSPIFVETFALADVGSLTTALPDEVACCLSIHGDLDGLLVQSGSTRPRSRHTGRLYIGPLGANTLDNSTVPGTVTVASAFRAAVLTAAADLVAATNAITGVSLRVYSRAGAASYVVTGAWMDNAYDTVRSRGPEASERLTTTF